MVSRIDRLFILLDTGSSDTVRLAAAKQLGEVQRIQPSEFGYLLRRIKEYSSKSLWETRVAAGHATRCVLEQVEPWPSGRQVPNEYQQPAFKETSLNVKDDDDKKKLAHKLLEQNVNIELIIQEFDLDKIISNCPRLLSLDLTKDADDYELATTSSKSSSTASSKASCGRSVARGGRRESRMGSLKSEQLSRQRKILNKELGTMDSLNIGVKSTDIVSNDELLQTDYEVTSSTNNYSQSYASKLGQENAQTVNTLSFITNYDDIIKLLTQQNCICTETNDQEELNYQSLSRSKKWPLEDITKQYTSDLFDPSWEIRHGAAIALREIVKLQGSYAGKRLELDEDSNLILNQLWLVDMALKSICVLALDKFGDFLFDQVVAPVRENAAQLLGCCIAKMTEPNACSTIKQTFKMLSSSNWETRHGGVLGLKYSLNVVDESFAKRMLQESFDPIFKCLGDPVDDVSAEAAAALVPVKDLMIETIPDKSPKLIKFLWNHLADLDELTTSTSNIVLLLASLITSSSAQLEQSELEKSLPRLWSLLNHSSTSVRISVLRALKTLLSAQESTCLTWLPEQLLTTLLRLLFQRAILENMEEVRPFIESTWMQLILIDIGECSSSNRFQLLKSTSQYLNFWLCLVMQPLNTPIDRGSPMWLNIGPDGTKSDTKPDGEVYIASYTFNAEVASQQKLQITKARLLGARLLGSLYANLINDFSIGDSPESQHAKQTMNYLADMFVHYLKIKSANQRIISGWTLESWASHQSELIVSDNKPDTLKTILPKNLVDQLNVAIQEVSLGYDELASTFTRLQQEARDFVSCLRDADISPNLPFQTDKRVIYNLNQIQILCDLNLELEITRLAAKRTQNISNNHDLSDTTKSKMFNMLLEKKLNLNKSLKNTSQSQKNLSTSVLGSLACAHISWHLLPQRIESLTDPLFDYIEIEEEQSLQDKSVNCIITLFNTLCHNLEQNKNLLDKLLNRLVNILSCQTLLMIANESNGAPTSLPTSPRCSIDSGKGFDLYKIVLLDNLQRKAELSRTTSRRQSSVTSGLKRSHSLTSSKEIQDQEQEQEQNSRLSTDVLEVKVRGASSAVGKLATHFGNQLPQKLPSLWRMTTSDIKAQVESHRKTSTIDEARLIKSLKLLEVVGNKVDVDLRRHLLELYEDLVHLLTVPNPWIRHHGAHCVGLISKLMFAETVATINDKIIPMLELHEQTLARCGAIEAIAMIIEHLQLDLVPRINMFIIHVLRRMSDQNDQVRLMATHCFGKLLSLMPLNLEKNKHDCNLNGQNVLTEEGESILKPGKEIEEKSFIEQLLDTKKLENYALPFEMKAELRPYQQDGLNWLAFLNRFNLHGILCDEMGLGKTLMTISMLVSDHINLTRSQKVSDDESSVRLASRQPSLIVCPSTLTEHWLYEVEKFLPSETRAFMNPVAYCGSMSERVNIRCQVLNSCNVNSSKENLIAKSNQPPVNLMVTSYDMVRNDIEFFKEVHWNYCVLDEGHIIKNGKTKLSRAIRLLNAKHRLILSGTPIQNNVTELWSLFDFLMPGFLGSDRQFNSKYAKPILQSRELKCSARDLEAGALAMESLHRQVLPFILRRVKEDVLADLPPKIIQDYYCELSPLQHKLYEDFTRSKLCNEVTKRSIHTLATTTTPTATKVEDSEIDSATKSKSHVFQALQYLKNVCNHPKLVLTAKHSQYEVIKKSLDNERSSLDDIVHSSKLTALKQLLIDCGIGVQSVEEQQQQQQQQALSIQSVVNQHRALIFCQVRSMVEIIENDLLKRHLPSVTYLRLDGSVAANQRHSIVSRFNNDPSIDILLLTTQIGGLGLNLTGADTVIFVEHDWNPTKDLQAMDRAHRIGQKKVVNVYRLITKATLEEKIMGLQKFKTMVSNTVINQDNAGLGSMNVDQLFDLFEDSDNSNKCSSGRAQSQKASGSSSSSFMDLLPELWDQQQYETEYDLSSFVSSLKQ